MRKNEYSEKIVKEAIRLYENGLAIEAAGEKLGIPYTTFARYLRKYNIPLRKRTKTQKPLDELKNKVINGYTILENCIEDGRIFWNCKCDCGFAKWIRQTDIIKGRFKKCRGCIKGIDHHSWTGYTYLSGTRWKYIRKCARRRDLIFEITKEYVVSIFEKQEGKCALSGLKLEFSENCNEKKYPSLDRIDSSQGYIMGNVQWVHKDVNKIKKDLKEDYFIKLCKLIAKN